jgi:hypothetical protein
MLRVNFYCLRAERPNSRLFNYFFYLSDIICNLIIEHSIRQVWNLWLIGYFVARFKNVFMGFNVGYRRHDRIARHQIKIIIRKTA